LLFLVIYYCYLILVYEMSFSNLGALFGSSEFLRNQLLKTRGPSNEVVI
jgi:hypothetical protein